MCVASDLTAANTQYVSVMFALGTKHYDLAADCRDSALAHGHSLWINTAMCWRQLPAATVGE